MLGNYGFSINLQFVGTAPTILSKNILIELNDKSNESIILNQTLLKDELVNGNIFFSGTNEDIWRYPYDQEVVDKLSNLVESYGGSFVGVFEWNFYDDDITKVHTFYKSGKISTEFSERNNPL